MSSSSLAKKIYLITGSNRGLGLGTVKLLLNKNIKESKDNIIILSSRSEEKGKEALNEVKSLFPSQTGNLDYVNLDTENMTHIKQVKEHINSKYGYLSFLHNNAGYFDKKPKKTIEENSQDIIKTMSINFFSSVLLTESFINLIKNSPKELNPQILFTGSLMGQRCFNNKDLNKSLEDGSITNLEKLYYNYLESCYNNKLEDWHYKHYKQFGSYGISKVFVNSYMTDLAKRLENDNIKVNTYNPGWVKTDMGGKGAPLSIEQGVDTVEWIVDNYNNIQSGKCYESRKEVSI